MPLTPSLPTWGAWNNANFTSPTGLTDSDSGQPIAAGGLNLGEYFDATNMEAANASSGALYAGRYRLVQVDSGATAANVRTGTVGFLRAGGSGAVKSAVIINAGTGGVAGTYTVTANLGSGGGSGATLQVTVGSNGTIQAVTVLNGGYNYNSLPTFNFAVTGVTGAQIAVQTDASPNFVTSADQVGVTAVAARPVVFLNSITPGNYGFIQELGTATLLSSGTIASGAFVNASNGVGQNGTVSSGGTTFIPTTIGVAIDTASAGNPFKVLLTLPTVQD